MAETHTIGPYTIKEVTSHLDDTSLLYEVIYRPTGENLGRYHSYPIALATIRNHGEHTRSLPAGIRVTAPARAPAAAAILIPHEKGGLLAFAPKEPTGAVFLAHEIAHAVINRDAIALTQIESEEAAWRLAAKYLRRTGEWTPEARRFAIAALSGYYSESSRIGYPAAKRFIEGL